MLLASWLRIHRLSNGALNGCKSTNCNSTVAGNRRKGDWEGVSGAFAADAEYRPPAQRARVGRAAIERYYREERPVILGLHRVDEILSGDGITVVTGEFVGESRKAADGPAQSS